MEPRPCRVYLLRCRDGSLYVGVCCDLKARLDRHNGGRGAKYTRRRRPVQLVYHEWHNSRREAVQRELELKKWRKPRKEQLVRGFVAEATKRDLSAEAAAEAGVRAPAWKEGGWSRGSNSKARRRVGRSRRRWWSL